MKNWALALAMTCIGRWSMQTAAADAPAHKTHVTAKKKHTKARTSSTRQRKLSDAAEKNLGTKGFPPKPLPSADPRNPADPEKAPVNQQRTPSPTNPVVPPEARR